MKYPKKLIYPPFWLTVILSVASIMGLICVFVNGLDNSPIAYAVYVISFYTLTVVCIFLVRVLPKRYKQIKKKVYDNPFGNRYMTDAAYRTHVSLYFTLAVNLLYVAASILSAVIYRTAWFAILAVYYGILAVMRFLLLRFLSKKGVRKDPISEFRRSRLCGFILMTLNLTLSGAVLMMIYQNKGYEYHGILIYVMAFYTFFITVNAIVGNVRYRKYNSPVMSTAKSISLASALVSMLALETAMLSQFGTDTSDEFRRIMIAATGAAVCITVIAMSVYMIVKANKEIKKLKAK